MILFLPRHHRLISWPHWQQFFSALSLRLGGAHFAGKGGLRKAPEKNYDSLIVPVVCCPSAILNFQIAAVQQLVTPSEPPSQLA
jgi:hypothetical protein